MIYFCEIELYLYSINQKTHFDELKTEGNVSNRMSIKNLRNINFKPIFFLTDQPNQFKDQ